MTDLTRRQLLAAGTAGAAALAVNGTTHAQLPADAVPDDFKVGNGAIRQSVMGWCFNPMKPLDLARHCKAIGLVAIEGIPASAYPEVTRLGLKISLVGSHGFQNGPASRDHHAACIAKLRQSIDTAVEFGCPSVITFTGMREKGLTDAAMTQNCIDCWREVVPYAEEKNVNLVLEHLNSRDDTHPMKGHPGYFGDDVDFCVDLIEQVDSPRMKLLFDVYHVQIMNGDVIRRIRQYKDVIGHYHTAGNPGRGELDDTQEINYPPIMREILATGYEGFVAQEFIPTWDDPIKALRHAAKVCDVERPMTTKRDVPE